MVNVDIMALKLLSRNYTADAAQPRFPEQMNRQAVQMCMEGASISEATRVVGASVPSVSG